MYSLGFRAFYPSRRRACADIHSIEGLRRSGYSFIIWEKNCNCVGLAARRPLASLRYFRVAAMFDGSSSQVLSLLPETTLLGFNASTMSSASSQASTPPPEQLMDGGVDH